MNADSTSGPSREAARKPFWVAAGFLAAFAATILTVILTGLYVRGPASGDAAERTPTKSSSQLIAPPSAAAEPTDAGSQSEDERADDQAEDRRAGRGQ